MKLSDFVTDDQGRGDNSRLLGILGGLALIALTAFNCIALRHPFDPTAFGEGLGWFLAGAGAHAFGTLKGKTT